MNIQVMGECKAQYYMLEPVMESEQAQLAEVYAALQEALPGRKILLAGLVVDKWEDDLSPWSGPDPFGRQAFGGKATQTLAYIQGGMVPALQAEYGMKDEAPLILGGYSLAGLFALWAGYQTDKFAACMAASPSVWFPGWEDYVRNHRFLSKSVYLSLGRSEELTKNPIMAQVGRCIRMQQESLFGGRNTLEWHVGGHFRNVVGRIVQGYVWCIRQMEKRK